MTNFTFLGIILLGLMMNEGCSPKSERVEKNATKKLYKTMGKMLKTLEDENCDYVKFMDKYLDPMIVMRFKEEDRLDEIAKTFGESEKKGELIEFLKLAQDLKPKYLNDYKTNARFEHKSMERPLLFENIDGTWYLRN